MLEVSAAREIVLRHARPLPPRRGVPPAVGRVLAEDVAADIDSPPFDKALMDGYAVRCADAAGGAELAVTQEIPAGTVPTKPVGPGEAARIYTGAPLPAGADAVVMQERTEPLPGGRVRLLAPATPDQHVLRRGREMAAGEVVIPAGTVITPAAIGLLAAVGRTEVTAIPAPRVIVLPTGDELVEPPAAPGPGQIRNTNGPMLAALAGGDAGSASAAAVAPDDEPGLRRCAEAALGRADVLVLSGGVSAGKLDLVPKVLADLGVTTHFHKVRMKPGKPLLFGTLSDKLVFGLPGNPVSGFVGFELFVRPALRALGGHPDPGPRVRPLPLAEPFRAANDRPTYHPAKRSADGRVRGLPWFGSPDLRGLLAADSLLVLPPGEVNYPAGTAVDVVVW
jgi:molybdopterin molybdotransferase